MPFSFIPHCYPTNEEKLTKQQITESAIKVSKHNCLWFLKTNGGPEQCEGTGSGEVDGQSTAAEAAGSPAIAQLRQTGGRRPCLRAW